MILDSDAIRTHGQCRGRETVGEVDLRLDGVGQVGDHQDVLDVVVAVVRDFRVSEYITFFVSRPWLCM